MKNLNIVYITIIFMLLTSVVSSQDRNVLWSHGLGENANTWNQMEAIFDNERRMNGESPGYPSAQGVATGTTNTIGDMEFLFGQNGSREPQNIGIGHSMGGVVNRNIDITETGSNQRLGGIITIGSPNDGIILSNNIDNGRVDNAIAFACNEIIAGPSIDLPLIVVVVEAIESNDICGIINDVLINELLENQTNNQSAQDMQVGSPVMNTINSGGSGIPQISIWGNERSPVHWRLLSSLTSNNANDTEWVERADDFRSVYNGFYIGHLSVSISCAIAGFFAPPCWAVSAINGFQASQWKRGVNWFDNSEGIWNQLIGCGGDITQTTSTVTITLVDFEEECACEEIEEEYQECIEEWLEKCANNPEECWVTKTTYRTVIVNKRSDGFICEDAQIIDGIPQENIYPADDANHMEETIHQSVRDRLDEIFRGDRGPGDFFTTQPR